MAKQTAQEIIVEKMQMLKDARYTGDVSFSLVLSDGGLRGAVNVQTTQKIGAVKSSEAK